ncbi:chemotaxis protein CheA [Allosphingosinicella flava]|uniref:Chemotaxis protein CheA n=1 Tax=Allosphingosinicella flava TaxID=2771430 RepID=A0A7T2LMZ7_9SPHN|nr:chemotaxis protein CheA [Sphingosinicella flava]QPQ55823.1 chemotaxis protein CheA [Sphingosinicella flava]
MDDLLDDFIAETRDMLDALSGEIVAWEANPGDRERLDAIFRFVHTVKGNCGFFELPRLENLSHAAEDALAEVRSGRREADHPLVSAVLAIIDRIGEIVQSLQTGEAVPNDNDEFLISALTQPVPTPRRDMEEQAPVDLRAPVRSIRLSVELLDRMMNGVSDMVLARNELARRLRETEADPVLEAAFDRVSACIAEMREAITRTRMQRIDNLFASLPRMVRDLSVELGKKVALDIDGGDVELDREMIEMIRDPLTHIIRNALDHGLETAEDRLAAGKATIGQLRVHARQSGNQILIEVADDGRGIDGERLLKKALAAGIVTPARAETMTLAQKVALIFEPGLSTAREVTAISGRGVGMDVVRANVEKIGGVVDLDSKPGHGLRLTLRVPLTLTIIPALTVSAGGQKFAIPRSAIEEIVRYRGAVTVESLGGSKIANIRGKRMARVSLSAALGMAETTEERDQTMIVLKPAGADLYALAVDVIHDHEELVIKPAAPPVIATGLYAGTTLADDGRPILLLDCAGIAAAAGVVLDAAEAETAPVQPVEEMAGDRPATLLFRTLEGRCRAVRLALVERIEDVPVEAVQVSAGRLRVTIRDALLPLAGCAAAPSEGKMRLLRLTDGTAELAYAFREVIDIVPLASEVIPAAVPGEVGGVTLINGEPVEMLDPFWLFAAHCSAEGLDAPLTCALPSSDAWMHNILRPILENAGYRVIAAEGADPEAVDVLIAADGEAPPGAPKAKLLRLRANPDDEGGDGSVYRYDRAGLFSALTERSRAKAGQKA